VLATSSSASVAVEAAAVAMAKATAGAAVAAGAAGASAAAPGGWDAAAPPTLMTSRCVSVCLPPVALNRTIAAASSHLILPTPSGQK